MGSTLSEEARSLLHERRNAVAATLNRDGSVQLNPVWYILDGSTIYISTSNRAVKARNLRRDARLSVCVEGGQGDFRYVTISGKVRILEHGEALQEEMRWRIIRRYHESDEAARAYAASTDDGTQVMLVLEPERVVAKDYN